MFRVSLLLSLVALTAGFGSAQVAVASPAQNKTIEEFFNSSSSYLGVNVQEIDSARAKELKLKEEHGVEVTRVQPDSPAAKAGLKEHDAVLEYNGQRVEGTESFIRMVRETPVGRTAALVVSRDGNAQALTATIGRRKEAHAFAFAWPTPPVPPMPPMPPVIEMPRATTTMRTTRIGIETEALSGQLAEFFGVKEGLLVRSVDKDSPAEKSGLRAGDVIVKVDGSAVSRTRDLTDELRFGRDKKTIPLQVLRNKKEITLNLELPDRAADSDRSGRAVGFRFQVERL